MNEKELIPKDKFDLDAVARLSAAVPEQVAAIACPLLEWIEDANWPVTDMLLRVLPKYHKELMLEIENILENGDDVILKNQIVGKLLPQFPEGSLVPVLPVICKLANMVANSEDDEELKESAVNLLGQYHDKQEI